MPGKKRRWFLIILLIVVVGLIVIGQLAQRIPEQTVLVLNISGAVEEEDAPSFEARFWEGDVTVFRKLLEALDRAKSDHRIVGVSLEVGDASMYFGKLQELRQKLEDFTSSGKFCTAYLESADNLSYYLASACPEVYLTPTGLLELKALMAHTTFRRGTYDKLGIYPDLYHIAEYKTAKNISTEKKYTAAHREMVTALLTGWQAQMVSDIAASRKLEAAQVEELIAGGPYLSEEALEGQLVDKLLYYDEYRDLLEKKAGSDDLETAGVNSYLSRSRSPSGPAVAIVHATGAIVTGKSGYTPSGGRFMGSDTVAAALRAAREDDSIKAIVLRVDSPGGSPVASEIVRREVVLAKAEKPVVVSMSDLAASGGYWIAMSADKIVADAGTLTGSIGVVYGKLNVKGLYELLGLTKDYVALGPNATINYPFENYTPAQRQTVLKFMRDIYDKFLEGVSEGRELPVEEVHRIGRGRVWLGDQAKELGLVDEVGGLERAVALAKELAKIPADQSVRYKIYPREKTTWEQFEEWLQIRTPPGASLRVLVDPARSPLLREPASLEMPFELQVD